MAGSASKGTKRPASGGAASSSGGAAPPDAKKRVAPGLTGKVQQKLNENFRSLSSMEMDVLVDPATGFTLRQRIEADIKKRESGDQGLKKQKTKHTPHTTTTTTNFLFSEARASRSGGSCITTG